MSNRENYTDEEWGAIYDLSCIGVTQLFKKDMKNVAVGISDVASKIREVVAMVKYSATAKQKFAGNALIMDLLNALSSGVSSENRGKPPRFYETDEIKDLIAQVNSILEEKSDPTESGEYRAMVYSLAFEIANASGDGFLGFGEKINAKEAEFLKFLKEELIGSA